MKYGLTPPQFEYIQNEVINPLSQLGAKVFCFGSRCRGSNHAFSDLDLMIEGQKNLALERLASQIQEKVTEGSFPYKVDLVFLEDFALSYRDNYESEKSYWPSKPDVLFF
jgi:predicted nucleotidyltransferase